MNSNFSLRWVLCADGLTRLRARAVWPGPGHGKLIPIESLARYELWYVGSRNMVMWWLEQPERRADTPDLGVVYR
jgi:hypothetical protein